MTEHLSSSYAGIWERTAAYLVDKFVFAIAWGILTALASVGQVQLSRGNILIQIIIEWIYVAGMQSSAFRGTLGYILLGLNVCDYEHKRLTFERATLRYIASIASMLSIIGPFFSLFTTKKQMLHDLLANTVVLAKHEPQPTMH